jgi:hypothetical protein
MGGGGGYGGGVPGGGGMGRSRAGDSDEQGGGTPGMHAVVRWESAAPLSAALKKSVPPEAAESYIISVTGLRMRRPPDAENESSSTQTDDDQRTADRLMHATTLEIKGKDSISPSGVKKVDDVDGPIWRFTFARSGNPIAAQDKEVTFITHLGRATLKAKFPLKEMMYKDQLAL